MSVARRIPLNPCDYLYFAHHDWLRRTVQSGNIAFMMIDAEGHPDPDDIKDALAAAMLAHPVTIAKLKISLARGRPYWCIPRSLPQAAQRAAEQAYCYDDLRTSNDWQARLDQLCLQRYAPDWDLAAGPQVRFEQYALPNDATRFCIRWPHLLMDAEGAQLFLWEIERRHPSDSGAQSPQGGGLPPEIAPDDDTIDVLADHAVTQRLRWFRRGFSLSSDRKDLQARPLFADADSKLTDFGLVYRNWNPEEVRQIQDNAKRTTPGGPALYARHLAACVIRALHRVYIEAGKETDAYLITLPLRVTLRDRHGNIRKKRPVPGNYLVSPTLCGRLDVVADKQALAADILHQLDAYRQADGDLVQWTLISAATHMRASWYPLLFQLPLGFETLSSGFSYYGEPIRSVRSLGGCKLTNVCGGGPLATPPGWNPTFSKFQDRLNLTMTWNRPAVPDDVANRYVDFIEQEILAQ